MPAVSPLAVAAVAGALLLVVLGVDASMNRTFYLDVQVNGEWQTVAENGEGSRGYVERYYAGSSPVFAANETVDMRLRVDNGYPWAWTGSYHVLVQGRTVEKGDVRAPARGEGDIAFEFNASAQETGLPEPAKGEIRFLYVQVEVGGRTLMTNLQVVPK